MYFALMLSKLDIIFKILLVDSIIFTPPSPSAKNNISGFMLLWIIYYAL